MTSNYLFLVWKDEVTQLLNNRRDLNPCYVVNLRLTLLTYKLLYFIFRFIYSALCVQMCLASMYIICNICVPAAHRDQKIKSDPLELKSQMVVTHYHVDAGSKTWVLCSQCS